MFNVLVQKSVDAEQQQQQCAQKCARWIKSVLCVAKHGKVEKWKSVLYFDMKSRWYVCNTSELIMKKVYPFFPFYSSLC